MGNFRRFSSLKHAPFYILQYSAITLCLLIFLPLLSLWFFPGNKREGPDYSFVGNIPESVVLYMTKEDKYEVIPFEEYIQGVVASEMPGAFELEALKAQAVASRSYALGKIKAGAELCDSVHCQAYRKDNIPDKVKQAVRATKGQVLLYKGELASHALFFSSSGGRTENSEDVFIKAVPYLVSVKSDYEPGATHKKETVTLSLSEFTDKLKTACPSRDFGKITGKRLMVKKYSEGGRAKEIRVGDETIPGTELRSALNLCSSRIEIKMKGNNIVIVTRGFGHGVGMSQYGANGMAKKGKTYEEILKHYYKGTTVSL